MANNFRASLLALEKGLSIFRTAVARVNENNSNPTRILVGSGLI